jgi:hypothetical protein
LVRPILLEISTDEWYALLVRVNFMFTELARLIAGDPAPVAVPVPVVAARRRRRR